MSFQDRIRSSVDAALDDLRTRVETDMRALVDQLVASAAQEREEAANTARRAAFDEARETTEREVAEAEARLQATADQALSAARAQARSDAERQLTEALAAAEARQAAALTHVESKAAQLLKESVEAEQARLRDSVAAVSRLLESIRALDAATSLSEVLNSLGQAAAREAARAAVLVVRNERLIGWKLSGFGAGDNQPKAIDLALTDGGVLAAAVGSARSVTTRDEQGSGPDFAQLPGDRLGLAVPVIVGARVVAVVYADTVTEDGRNPTGVTGWIEVIEILARHAARCLEALTVQKTAAPPSPRFWVPAASQPVGVSATKPVPPGPTA